MRTIDVLKARLEDSSYITALDYDLLDLCNGNIRQYERTRAELYETVKAMQQELDRDVEISKALRDYPEEKRAALAVWAALNG